MRFTTRQPADSVWVPLPLPIAEYVGQTVPLRIGDLAHSATLCSVEHDGDELVIVLDMADSDIRWEALIQPTV